MILKAFILLLPWFLRRRILITFFRYQIHPTARIGLSWIFPRSLIMQEGSRIGHFNVAVHLDLIRMGKSASIARSNWITGYATKTLSKHFQHQIERKAELIVGDHSAITKQHHFDCTNSICIGSYTTIAGYASQFLTHSIDVLQNRQDSHKISIGNYCFVGTNVVVLGGAVLPSYSVLGAKALLNKEQSKEWTLYGGVPAKAIAPITTDAQYFTRTTGFVY